MWQRNLFLLISITSFCLCILIVDVHANNQKPKKDNKSKISKEKKGEAEQRYYRCYSQMVRKLPLPDDKLLKMVKSGQIDGTSACMQLLELAQLDETSGKLSGIHLETSDQISESQYHTVLKSTFKNTLHSHLRKNKCINCHAGGRPIPQHSSKSTDTAYNAIFDNELIDLENIENSVLYTKILRGHQCNSEDCQPLANGIKDAISAWEKAFNKQYKGEVVNKTVIKDKLSDGGFPIIGQSILKTFNDFHRTWMSAQEKFELQDDCISETHDILDSGAHALYTTQSLFSNKSYKNVLTSTEPLKAIRYSPRARSNRSVSNGRIKTNFKWGHPLNSEGKPDYTNGTLQDYWTPPELVELGLLVGITLKDESIMPKEYLRQASDINLFRTDAGAINTPSYMILNNGIGRSPANGGILIQRRWSKAVFNDYLCRDLPVIRTADAVKYLDNEDKSLMPFRKGLSCMKCHASMDQAAKAARNTQVMRSYNRSCEDNANSLIVYRHPVSLEQHINDFEGWVDQDEKDYFRRPNYGKFYFRTHDGKLINQSFEGFEGLAQAITETDDYYICAAKRYLNFFTGVDVPMFDAGDISAPYLNKKEKEYQKFVIELGKELKEHQDLKQTIKRIISSKSYISPGKKVK